jgi:acyl-CoA synthetase (AMP-forming)/AMP-acid ligase II
MPGKTGMDEIWAVVVANGALHVSDLMGFCRERLADKAPDVIREIDAIPRAESGKVRRRRIREEMLRLAASQ